jgi:hypothetical protein
MEATDTMDVINTMDTINRTAGETGDAMTGHHHSSTCQHCPVCGSTALDTDQVEFGGARLFLGECFRCEHRWTRALGTPALQGRQRTVALQARGARPADREVASAA